MPNKRCRMLAHPIGSGVYRCPTGLRTFHYHAVSTKSPTLVIETMQRICEHRHREASAAQKCFEGGN